MLSLHLLSYFKFRAPKAKKSSEKLVRPLTQKMADTKQLSAEQRAEIERIALRDKVKRQYQRMVNDPRRPNVAIDPAIDRWNFVRQNAYQYFKATPKTSLSGFVMGILVPGAIIYGIVKNKMETDRRVDEGLEKKRRNYLAY